MLPRRPKKNVLHRATIPVVPAGTHVEASRDAIVHVHAAAGALDGVRANDVAVRALDVLRLL